MAILLQVNLYLRILESQNFRISEFQTFRISEFQNFRISESQYLSISRGVGHDDGPGGSEKKKSWEE